MMDIVHILLQLLSFCFILFYLSNAIWSARLLLFILFYFQTKYFLYVVVVVKLLIFRGEVLAHTVITVSREEKKNTGRFTLARKLAHHWLSNLGAKYPPKYP